MFFIPKNREEIFLLHRPRIMRHLCVWRICREISWHGYHLVGIILPDQVYNYTNGIITDSLAIYQGSTTDARYTAIFDAEIYETIPVTNARVQSTMTDIVMNYKLRDFVSTSKKELINSGIQVYP